MQGLSNEIIFKVGIKYMITFNIDVEDGLVNGECGILHSFTMGEENIILIWLEFPQGRNVGLKAREKFKDYVEANKINEELIPIAKGTAVITMRKNCYHQIMRKQFPIVTAEAVTIHKSQGQTYEALCLDFGRIKKATRQLLYVTMSRVTNLKNVYILGEMNVKCFHNGTISDCKEIEKLGKQNVATLCYKDLKNTAGTIIIYHNIDL